MQRLFADMTAVLEDLHGIAVEGRRRDNSVDMIVALIASVHERLSAVEAIEAAIRVHIAGRQP